MTPKEITTLAHHRLVPPWVMKLVLEATSIERERCAKVCEQDEFQIYETAERCAAAIRNLK